MNTRYRTLIDAFYLFSLIILTVGIVSCNDKESTLSRAQNTELKGIKEKIISLSPGFLKEIPGSSGVVTFKDNTRGGFLGHVELNGLVKGSYLMTLNENNQYPIKDELSGWRSWGNEQYLDFEQIYINDTGSYSGDFEVDLPPGKYTFKFFVKEGGGSFPSVLYNNFLKVKVQ